MKRIFLALLCLAVAVPAFANVDLNITILPPDSVEAARAFATAREAIRHRAGGIRPQAIIENSASNLLIIPVIGKAAGARGEDFRSDITFVNWKETSQAVEFIYLPSGNPAGQIVARGTLPGNRPPFTIRDFVGTQLNASGIGALLITPTGAGNAFDPTGAIDAHSRIYTPQPTLPSGTVSLQFPALFPGHLQGEYEAIILGLRQEGSFRTNVGIVNLENIPIDFVVVMFPEVGTQIREIPVRVPAFSMIQVGLPPDAVPGAFNVIVDIDTDVPNDDQWWTAYAASVDNTTGDGWVSIAARIPDTDLGRVGDR